MHIVSNRRIVKCNPLSFTQVNSPQHQTKHTSDSQRPLAVRYPLRSTLMCNRFYLYSTLVSFCVANDMDSMRQIFHVINCDNGAFTKSPHDIATNRKNANFLTQFLRWVFGRRSAATPGHPTDDRKCQRIGEDVCTFGVMESKARRFFNFRHTRNFLVFRDTIRWRCDASLSWEREWKKNTDR